MTDGVYTTPAGDTLIIPGLTPQRIATVYGDALALSHLVPSETEPLQFDASSFMAGVSAALLALAVDYTPLPSTVLNELERRHG